MKNRPKRKRTQRTRQDCVEQKSLVEIMSFLVGNPQASSTTGMCLECGSKSGLQKATISLWGSSETREILLPICELCASKGNADLTRPKKDELREIAGCAMSEVTIQ